jgi:hypothetical protein
LSITLRQTITVMKKDLDMRYGRRRKRWSFHDKHIFIIWLVLINKFY